MNIWVGIDPGGSTGSICFLQEDEGRFTSVILRFSKETPTQIVAEFRKQIWMWKKTGGTIFCLLEKVHSMPGQGVSSSFKFGQNYGWITGVLDSLGIPYKEETPGQWMKKMNLLKLKGEEKPSHKKRRREFIERTYPHIKVVNDTFDSLTLAETARQHYSNYGRSYVKS